MFAGTEIPGSQGGPGKGLKETCIPDFQGHSLRAPLEPLLCPPNPLIPKPALGLACPRIPCLEDAAALLSLGESSEFR